MSKVTRRIYGHEIQAGDTLALAIVNGDKALVTIHYVDSVEFDRNDMDVWVDTTYEWSFQRGPRRGLRQIKTWERVTLLNRPRKRKV